jgi:ubiquinone/menaquinone biosynthesis C-methylase UbiE
MTDAEARKELLARTFDSSAQGYRDIRYFHLYAARLVELAGLGPESQVLDVACGRGAVLFAAAQCVGDDGHVLGVDLSPEMAQATAADIKARGISCASTATMDAERSIFLTTRLTSYFAHSQCSSFPTLPTPSRSSAAYFARAASWR